jgi:hypothetical protein
MLDDTTRMDNRQHGQLPNPWALLDDREGDNLKDALRRVRQKERNGIRVMAENRFHVRGAAVPNPNPDNLWWGPTEGAHIIEIGVFRHDGVSFALCEAPDVAIFGISKPVQGHMARTGEPIGQSPNQLAG